MATTLHPQPFIHVDRTTPQKVCVGMGWAFILIGVMGFMAPGFLGMHLSVAHNAIHLLSGILGLIFGLSEKPGTAYTFSWIFGTFYGLLGIAGFILGKLAFPSLGHITHEDRFLWSILPGALELGTNDHLIHILIGAIFLVPALWWRSKQIPSQS